MEKREISIFRIRGLTCNKCGAVQKIFGNDPVPEACPLSPCIGSLELEWDKIVDQSTTVTDFKMTSQP